MATTATITISTVDYTVYSLTADAVQDADDYHAARIGSTWSTATTLQKQQALISAARMMDRVVFWSGTKTSAAQAREWPRDAATNACTGDVVTDGTIPDDIALGEFELAGLLFLDASLQDAAGTGSNVKRVKAGSAEVEFFGATLGTSDDLRLPVPVNDIVGCYIAGSGLNGFSTGTSTAEGESAFDDCDQHDLNEGYP